MPLLDAPRILVPWDAMEVIRMHRWSGQLKNKQPGRCGTNYLGDMEGVVREWGRQEPNNRRLLQLRYHPPNIWLMKLKSQWRTSRFLPGYCHLLWTVLTDHNAEYNQNIWQRWKVEEVLQGTGNGQVSFDTALYRMKWLQPMTTAK